MAGPIISISDPANPVISIILPPVADDVWGVEIRRSDNTTVIYHADLADAGTSPQFTDHGNTVRQLDYYVYTYNLLGEYSAPFHMQYEISTWAFPGAPLT